LKIFAVGLFMFFAVVNLQVVTTANGSGMDLAGLKIEAFMPSATAETAPKGLILEIRGDGVPVWCCGGYSNVVCVGGHDCGL
ncbi:MAG TPA: hypothetical protein VK141_09820, partial [Nitrosomonas sp.]|nr:hypothetical protein [Nitrosomonas sp.]